MKEVTKETFYSAIGPLDVVLRVTGRSSDPGGMKTSFTMRYGKFVGYTHAGKYFLDGSLGRAALNGKDV